jgi:hypothetical protein
MVAPPLDAAQRVIVEAAKTSAAAKASAAAIAADLGSVLI